MSDNTIESKATLDISDFDAKLSALEARVAALRSSLADMPLGGGGRRSGSGGGGSAAFQQSQQTADPNALEEGGVGPISPLSRNYLRFQRAVQGGYAEAGKRGWIDFNTSQVDTDLLGQAELMQAQGMDADPSDPLGMQSTKWQARVQSAQHRQQKQQRQMDVLHARALQDNERFDQERDTQHWAHRDRQAHDMDTLDAMDARDRSRIERQAEREVGSERSQQARSRSAAEREYDDMFKDMRQDAVKKAQAFDFEEDSASTGRMGNFARGALYGVGRAAQMAFTTSAQEVATGHGNPMGMAGAGAGAFGAILGAGIGSFMGPFGGLIGGRVGEGVGSGIGEYAAAFSFARNTEAQANFGYSYGLNQSASAGFDAQAQRGFLQVSGMDERFMMGGSKPPAFSEYLLRATGFYNGNDQSSAQAQGSIQRSLGTAAMNQGRIYDPNRLRGLAEDWALDASHPGGVEGLAAAQMLEKYTGAQMRFGGSDVDMLASLGTDGYLGGARAAGVRTDPQAVVNYQRAQAGNDRELRYDTQNTAAFGIEMAGAKGRGGLVGDDLFSGLRTSLHDSIKDTEAKLAEAIRMGGEGSELAGSLRNSVRQLYAEIGNSLHAQAQESFGYGAAQNANRAGDTALQQNRTILSGNAGDFMGRVLPMQQADAQATVGNLQRYAATLPEGIEKQNVLAQIKQVQAGAMMLPAQAQAQDIGRAEQGFGAQRAELGVGTGYAGIYGTAGDITSAGQANIGQIQSERRYWQNLTPQSAQQAAEKRTKLAQLDQQEMQVNAGVATSTVGIQNQQAGLALGQTGFGIAAAGAFGSDQDVANAYTRQAEQRQSQISVLSARANDASLPRDVRMQAQRDLLQQQQGAMQDAIAGRDVELGRMDTRAGLRSGDTGFALDRARRVGGAGDFRSAVGGELGELSQESGDIDRQLARGGLTFAQESGLRRRQQGLRRESFDLSQSAIDEGYQKEDLEGYDVARLQSRGALRRAQMLPFGMGNGLALEMGQVGQNNARRQQLQGRYNALQQSGNLSPQRRMELLREDDSLQTENTETLSHLARGMEDYLPGLSSGAPSGFAHWNTLNLAALRMGQAGSLAGNFGFAGGGHEAQQQGMLRNLTGGSFPGSGMAGGLGREAGLTGIPELTAAVNALNATLSRGGGLGGNGMRVGEAVGSVSGMLDKVMGNVGQKGAQYGR